MFSITNNRLLETEVTEVKHITWSPKAIR